MHKRLYTNLVLLSLILAFTAAANAQIPNGSQQLLVTVSDSWSATTGNLYAFDRTEEGWAPILQSIPVNLGRTGLAWGLGLHPQSVVGEMDPQKREGDGKAPAGIFSLTDAFGYPSTLKTGLNYQPMRASHYCVDVPSSPLYNQTVDAEVVGKDAVQGSSEGMRRDVHYGDQQYKKGIFVAHNPANIPKAGSCIFVHLWKAPGSPTAGCTAMAEPQMDSLLEWLKAERQPVYLALPRTQYRVLRAQWGLPKL